MDNHVSNILNLLQRAKIQHLIHKTIEQTLWGCILCLIYCNVIIFCGISFLYSAYPALLVVVYLVISLCINRCKSSDIAQLLDQKYQLQNRLATSYFAISHNLQQKHFYHFQLQDTCSAISTLPRFLFSKNYNRLLVAIVILSSTSVLVHSTSQNEILVSPGVIKISQQKIHNMAQKLEENQQASVSKKFVEISQSWSPETLSPQEMLEDIESLQQAMQNQTADSTEIENLSEILEISPELTPSEFVEKLQNTPPQEMEKIIAKLQKSTIPEDLKNSFIKQIHNRDLQALQEFWKNLKRRQTQQDIAKNLQKLSQSLRSKFQLPGTSPGNSQQNSHNFSPNHSQGTPGTSPNLSNSQDTLTEVTPSQTPDWYADITKPSWPKKYHRVVKKYFDLKRGNHEKQE